MLFESFSSKATFCTSYVWICSECRWHRRAEHDGERGQPLRGDFGLPHMVMLMGFTSIGHRTTVWGAT